MLRSKRYEVPLVNLYPSVVGENKATLDFEASASKEYPSALSGIDIPVDTSDTLSCSSDASFVEINIPERVQDTLDSDLVQAVHQSTNVTPRRSKRVRNQPDRYNVTGYNPNNSFSSETDVIQNWWPNYPRGSWSSDQNT